MYDDRLPLRVFAGLRSDPFFLDIIGLAETIALQKAVDVMPPAIKKYFDEAPPDETTLRVFKFDGKNTVEGRNVLSIVAEADVAKVFWPEAGPLFAISAETMERVPRGERHEIPSYPSSLHRPGNGVAGRSARSI